MPYSTSTVNTGGNVQWTGSLPNVLGVRLRTYAYNHTSKNDHGNHQENIYEIQAWGQVYKPTGLKYEKAGVTYQIGGEELNSTHKIRVKTGSTTLGIPLLDTTDAYASPIRVFNGTAVKSLPKI